MAKPGATRSVRNAVINFLKTDSGVTALQPAERIYPQQVLANPGWPYTHMGATIDTPLRGSCLDGRTISFAVHTYAKTGTAGSGESIANDIADAIATAMDGAHISLDNGSYIDCNWITNNTIRDPSEASVFHSICQVQCDLIDGV